MTVTTDKDYLFKDLNKLFQTWNELMIKRSKIPAKDKDGIYTKEWLSVDMEISEINIRIRFGYEDLGKEMFERFLVEKTYNK